MRTGMEKDSTAPMGFHQANHTNWQHLGCYGLVEREPHRSVLVDSTLRSNSVRHQGRVDAMLTSDDVPRREAVRVGLLMTFAGRLNIRRLFNGGPAFGSEAVCDQRFHLTAHGCLLFFRFIVPFPIRSLKPSLFFYFILLFNIFQIIFIFCYV